MGQIQDLWHTVRDGERVRSDRYGRGKRWRARIQSRGRDVSRSFDRKADAERWLRIQTERIESGDWVSPRRARETFGTVAERWLRRPSIRASTRERDASYLRSMILPSLGERPIGDISGDEISELLSELSEDRAPSTVRKAGQMIGAILRTAVEGGLLSRAPEIRLPRVEREEIRILDPSEIWELAEATGPDRGMILLGGFGGLRLGEVLGLQERDVDRARRIVRIERTASDLSDRVEVSPPKTSAGRRAVPLPAPVIEALPIGDPWIWSSPEGGPRRRRSWARRVWRPATEELGLSGLRFHDLRHSYASRAIASGVDPISLSRALGHSSPRMVWTVYGHLLDPESRDFADRDEELLRSLSPQRHHDGGDGR